MKIIPYLTAYTQSEYSVQIFLASMLILLPHFNGSNECTENATNWSTLTKIGLRMANCYCVPSLTILVVSRVTIFRNIQIGTIEIQKQTC